MTGIRAIAAGWVLLAHLMVITAGSPYPLPIGRIVSCGSMGVDIFFVLSGFIISYNYADRLGRFEWRGFRTFLHARFARMYPVHLLTLTATAVWLADEVGTLVHLPAPYTPGQFVANLAMLQGFPRIVAWNAPAWTITCEAVAYLVFPFAAARLLRVRPVAAAVAAVAVLAVELTLVEAIGGVDVPANASVWLRIAGEFPVGCLLWALWRHRVRPGRWWDAVAVGALGSVAGVLTLPLSSDEAFLVVPLLALFVLAAASATGPVRTVLASRPMVWGGKISYSLYLTHFLLVLAFQEHLGSRFAEASTLGRLGLLAAMTAVMIGTASIVYYMVEEPARRWLRRRPVSAPHAVRSAVRNPEVLGPRGLPPLVEAARDLDHLPSAAPATTAVVP